MALVQSEVDRVLAAIHAMTPTAHAAAYCMEHLAQRAGLPPGRLDDLRMFVRALRAEPSTYTVSAPGVCDAGPHGVTDLVIRARVASLPTRG